MRPHGRAEINARSPRALGVCERCGFLYNHDQLRWQYEWRGISLQNIRILVCETCQDKPQDQLRVIILPPDPVPILNARPENYPNADNPMSPIGADANQLTPQYGSRIGNLIGNGGLNAAFDRNRYKPAWMSAANAISNSSYNNYVGINWTGYVGTLTMPSSLLSPVVTHTVVSFTAYAPNDKSFLGNTATSYVVQSSPTGGGTWGEWTTFSSGTTAGTAGESISGTFTSAKTQFHRIAFLGDGLNPVSVAQLELNVGETGSESY